MMESQVRCGKDEVGWLRQLLSMQERAEGRQEGQKHRSSSGGDGGSGSSRNSSNSQLIVPSGKC